MVGHAANCRAWRPSWKGANLCRLRNRRWPRRALGRSHDKRRREPHRVKDVHARVLGHIYLALPRQPVSEFREDFRETNRHLVLALLRGEGMAHGETGDPSYLHSALQG